MSVTDPIADMLVRVRNACRAGAEFVEMSHSNMKNEIARILKKEGFIKDFVTEGHGGKKELRLYLKYDAEQKPVIQGMRRVSKPGLRQYVKTADIPRVRGGMGMSILSTSKGILTDGEARREKIGGEMLCQIW